MKYLTQFIEKPMNKLLDDCGAFYAFSQKQLDEQKQDGIKYINIGMGLICPSENVEKFIIKSDLIFKEGIKKDIKEHGKKRIIWRELGNYETQINGELDTVYDVLKDYNITEEEIKKEFKKYYEYCIREDLF